MPSLEQKNRFIGGRADCSMKFIHTSVSTEVIRDQTVGLCGRVIDKGMVGVDLAVDTSSEVGRCSVHDCLGHRDAGPCHLGRKRYRVDCSYQQEG